MATKKKATKAKKTTSRARGAARKPTKKAAAKRPAKKPAKKVVKATAKKPAKKAAAKVVKAAVKKPAKKAAAKVVKAAAKKPAPTTVAKKTAIAKAAPKAKPAASRKPAAMRREDRAGHLDPRYVAELRSRSRSERPPADPPGFINGPRSKDDLVEQLGEEYVGSATSGEYEAEDGLNQDVPEEVGGPFVESSERQEFAQGTDASNPKGATREPFPRT